MRIAILLYDDMAALDAIGPFEVFRFGKDTEVVFTGKKTGEVRAGGNLGLVVDRPLAEVPSADVVLVPGGTGQVELMDDPEVHEWLREVDRTSSWTTSVCTGSLLLAAAGLLDGRKATSHWLALEHLSVYGAVPTEQRVVFDGKYVTAAGVSAGIDMALELTDRIAGDVAAQAIQLGIEYDPQPPHDAGSPAKAPADIVARMRENRRSFLRES